MQSLSVKALSLYNLRTFDFECSFLSDSDFLGRELKALDLVAGDGKIDCVDQVPM